MTPSWRTTGVAAALVATTIVLRLLFWQQTGETLEDSLITLRYADNIAAGNGFVYNPGEHVLGTTTPLWTLTLAGVRALGIVDVPSAAKLIGIACDVVTLLLLLSLLRTAGEYAALLFGLLFATSPWIIRIAVSGMETPLLLLAMTITLTGLHRRNVAFGVGLALTMLTRIDGAIYAGVMLVWAALHDLRWTMRQTGIAAVLCLPWIVFALATFGSVIPQTFTAKRAVYHLGSAVSAPPFLNAFTPMGEHAAVHIAAKGIWCVSVLAGLATLLSRRGVYLPLALFFIAYTASAMTSGMLIFSWYLVPAVFVACIGIAVAGGFAADKFATRRSLAVTTAGIAAAALLVAFNTGTLASRIQRSRDGQALENGLRAPIGRWLKEHTAEGSRILLEPIGYIGYYAGTGRIILDEIGLVTPQMVALRQQRAGWYVPALQALDPDYCVQYTSALRLNRSEGTGDPLFATRADSAWFSVNFEEIARFSYSDDTPSIEEKEKEYVILRRRNR
jgi:hypothetical protein